MVRHAHVPLISFSFSTSSCYRKHSRKTRDLWRKKGEMYELHRQENASATDIIDHRTCSCSLCIYTHHRMCRYGHGEDQVQESSSNLQAIIPLEKAKAKRESIHTKSGASADSLPVCLHRLTISSVRPDATSSFHFLGSTKRLTRHDRGC